MVQARVDVWTEARLQDGIEILTLNLSLTIIGSGCVSWERDRQKIKRGFVKQAKNVKRSEKREKDEKITEGKNEEKK